MKKPFVSKDIVTQRLYRRHSKKKIIQTKSRDSIITKASVGYVFKVYNGRGYKRVLATPARIGHHLGEFVFTKKMGSSIHLSEHNRKRKQKAEDIRLGLRKKKKGAK